MGYDLGVVGKGITFDSGGISIKPAEEMHLMKYDMSGAAAVIGRDRVIARLRLPVNVICVAPCTENLPGGHATKPGDVVTSMSGKTVEIINTDAEGRLVLIDGVTYAEREGAQRVVDVATLTGAIRIALGQHYTGLFGRPRRLRRRRPRAGDAAGERLWPMPLSDEYRDKMKGEVADLRNSAGRLGSAINGAAFIEAGLEPSTEWAHLDIASSGWFEEDRPFRPRAPQGPMVGVRTLVELGAPARAVTDPRGTLKRLRSLRPNRKFGKMSTALLHRGNSCEGPMKRSLSIALAIAGLLVGLAPVTVMAEGGLTIDRLSGGTVRPGRDGRVRPRITSPPPERVDLTVSGTPEGWTTRLRGGGSTISAVYTSADPEGHDRGDGPTATTLEVTCPSRSPRTPTRSPSRGERAAGVTARMTLDITVQQAGTGSVSVMRPEPAAAGQAGHTSPST